VENYGRVSWVLIPEHFFGYIYIYTHTYNLCFKRQFTVRVGVDVTFWACIRDVFVSNLSRDIGYPETLWFSSGPSYRCQDTNSIFRVCWLEFLRRYQSLSYSVNYPLFIELEESATGPCPESDRFTPSHLTYLSSAPKSFKWSFFFCA
jgi:hypothetical protein